MKILADVLYEGQPHPITEEIEIVDPSALLLDESGDAGKMLAALRFGSNVKRVTLHRPERDGAIGGPRQLRSRSIVRAA